MSDGTRIEWTDATWNPITGCSVVSPGCTNCYAMRLAGARLQHHPSRAGLTRATKARPVWTGDVRFNEQWLDQPLRWKRPRRIFVCAHGDLFHESIPIEWIDKVFAVMALTPQHTFQVLTKRPERMRRYFDGRRRSKLRVSDALAILPHGKSEDEHDAACEALDLFDVLGKPQPNIWLGVSVEDQARADERIPLLLDTPAAVRWISAEPLLGPVDLTNLDPTGHAKVAKAHGWSAIWKGNSIGRPWLDWVVAGGESGPGARPMHPDWARSLRDQCQAASVAFHFKQWGDWAPSSLGVSVAHASSMEVELRGGDWRTPISLGGPDIMNRVGKKTAGRLLDGREWNEWPA